MSKPDGNGFSNMEERCRDCPWKCNPMPDVCPISDVHYIISQEQPTRDRIKSYVIYRDMVKGCGLDSNNPDIVIAFMRGHSKAYDEINEVLDEMECKYNENEEMPKNQQAWEAPCPRCNSGVLKYKPGYYTGGGIQPDGTYDMGTWNPETYICDNCGNIEYWSELKSLNKGE